MLHRPTIVWLLYLLTRLPGCLLQAQGVGGRPVKYSGMADVFRQTYANEGMRGFYKVCGGTCHAGLSGHGIPQLRLPWVCLLGHMSWQLNRSWEVHVIKGLLNVLQSAPSIASGDTGAPQYACSFTGILHAAVCACRACFPT